MTVKAEKVDGKVLVSLDPKYTVAAAEDKGHIVLQFESFHDAAKCLQNAGWVARQTGIRAGEIGTKSQKLPTEPKVPKKPKKEAVAEYKAARLNVREDAKAAAKKSHKSKDEIRAASDAAVAEWEAEHEAPK